MRSFIAIDFDDALNCDVADLQASLRSRCPKLTWIRPEQIHLTLKFLGKITDQDIFPIGSALDKCAAEMAPFEIQIEGVGVFPPSGRVNIVWVGITDAEKRLARLQARCEEMLAPLGFSPEGRGFTPHLTIARNKDPRQSGAIRTAVTLQGEPQFGAQRIQELIFYQSTPGPGGHTHHALSRHPFKVP